MKYIFIMFASLLLIAGCGKSELELEKERLKKEADDLKRRIDSTSSYIERERKSLDSSMKRIDTLGRQIDKLQQKIQPKKLGEDAIKKTDELIQTETPTVEPKKEKK
jgi:peptidoglycan hydrolase CwlO-like protein